MNCPSCKAENPPDAQFCARCGAQLAGGAAPSPSQRVAGRGRGAADFPEEVLWEGGYSAKAMVGQWFFAALVTVAAIVVAVIIGDRWWWAPLVAAAAVWAFFGLNLLMAKLSVKYRLTNKWFFHERGIFTRERNRIELIAIDDVSTVQSLVNRYFGVGTIHLLSQDVSDQKLSMQGVDEVLKVSSLIDSARRAERVRRGLFLKEVGGGDVGGE